MRTTRLLSIAASALIIAGCARSATFNGLEMSREEACAMEFLYNSMSIADIGDYDTAFFLENVKTALRARKEMPWGKEVPDQLFKHFVLPVRANNERLDDFRTMYYETLKDRVAGLSMHDAALEINHWCHEKVTYTPTDGRTSSPLASMLNAEGRCGEESTFTVAAMRTVGIPARQVYTPRWAHTDDNHAWVEVWTDGKWSFLGACEPEPELNLAWFNEPAARAMLMHTLVFGDYCGDEDVIRRTHSFTEINVIGNYATTRKNIVKVVDNKGNPVSNARVEFCIYNYGEFYPAVTLPSAEDGTVSLHTGIGDLLVWASKDGMSGSALLSGEGEDKICSAVVTLDRDSDSRIDLDIDINPPAPGRIPAEVTEEQVELNKTRLAEEDSIRNAYKATFFDRETAVAAIIGTDNKALASGGKLTPDGEAAADELVASKGNWRNILSLFRYAGTAGKTDKAIAILQNISRKDVRDTGFEVLEDFLDTAPGLSAEYKGMENLYNSYVLCPRIGGEFIQPYHTAIYNALSPELGDSPSAVSIVEWSHRNIALADSLNPRRLQGTPAGTLRNRRADKRSRDIFTVAALRTFGIPARVDPMTGKAQYVSAASGEWIDISASSTDGKASPKGTFTMLYTPGDGTMDNPEYYRHFSISRIDGGVRRLLEFEGGDATELGADASARTFSRPFTLDAGTYLLTSGSRMASGKVLSRMVSFVVKEGENTDVRLVMRKAAEDVSVIGSMDPEMKYLPLDGIGASAEEDRDEVSILATTGRGYFLIAIIGTGDEPTNHALRDLAGMKGTLEKWGRPIVILSPSARDASGLKMPDGNGSEYLAGSAHFGIDSDNSVRKMIIDGCHSKSATLPVIALCDSFGRVVYLSTGYNTSLGSQLTSVIERL